MTFETMINNANVNVNAAAEEVAVKVSFGNEMRRAAFNGTTFVALRDLVVRLFELAQRVVVLKYQDDDGDKITMSSDGELNDALRLVKDKKILRLFVEIPAPVPPTEEEIPADAAEHPFWGHWRGGRGGRGGAHFGGPYRGGSMGRFGHGPHAFPHHGPHGFPHGGPRFGPFCRPASPAQATEQAVPAPAPADGSVAATFHVPRVVSHGAFSPAGESFPRHGGSPYAARCAFKERKHAMKEHIKLMKENAITPEDREAIKLYKEQMRAECKARWQEFKSDRKDAKCERKDAKCERKDAKREHNHEREHFIAKHVADVTVPDNSELPPDTPVTKTWRLKNAGLVAWPADSQLLFVSRRGDNLNGPERVFVGPVEPQQEVDVSVAFLTPTEPGRYIGYYRMASGDGSKFGQRVWVSFIVPAPAPAAPAVAVAPQVASAPPTTSGDVNMD